MKNMIGQPGLQRFEVNAYGKRIKELKSFTEGSIRNKSYKTTIDQELQNLTSEIDYKEKVDQFVLWIYILEI